MGRREDLADCTFQAYGTTFEAFGPTASNSEWQAVSSGIPKWCIVVCAKSLGRCIKHAKAEVLDTDNAIKPAVQMMRFSSVSE